jgi:hypothetical protein
MMKMILQGLILVGVMSLVACKVVNTHTFKLTSSVQEQPTEMLLKTTIGDVHLSTEKMTDKDRALLHGILPFQCIKIRSSEPFSMQNYQAYYHDFELRTITVGEPDCRKIKTGFRISMR